MTKKFWLFFLIVSLAYMTAAQLSKQTLIAEDSSNTYYDDEDTEFC